MSVHTNVFGQEDLSYLLNHPETLRSRDSGQRVAYFTLPITDSIKTTLEQLFPLHLKDTLPMRWITGDTAAHQDSGASSFENTYLVYLTDSEGELYINQDAYPIRANTGFQFSEGTPHYTVGTEGVNNPFGSKRLLVGPLSEHGEPVGATVTYYSNYADAYAQNGNQIAYGNGWVLGSILSGSIGSTTTWRVASWSNGISPPSGVYSNGFDLSVFGNYGYYVYPNTPCFLEGSEILCLDHGIEVYRPIESLRSGMLVKTATSGYKAVDRVGHSSFQNPLWGHFASPHPSPSENTSSLVRMENMLYRLTPEKYPALKKDLVLTGCHSILVDHLTDAEKEETVKRLGQIYVTEGKYRLMAVIDERAVPYVSEKEEVTSTGGSRSNGERSSSTTTIWHLSLEHHDPKMNYGVYANGLLVETCSMNFMQNRSNLCTALLSKS